MLVKSILVLIFGFAVFLSGLFVDRKFLHKEPAPVVKIKEVVKTKTVTKYVKTEPAKMNCDELRKCAETPISIDIEPIESNQITVKASDGCKETMQTFSLKYDVDTQVKQKEKLKIFGLGVGAGMILMFLIL